MSRPLPRPASPRTSLRVIPVPRCEPPFDDERDHRSGTTGGGSRHGLAPTQGSLALSFTLPSGLPAVPEAPGIHDDDVDFGPQRTSSRGLPDPRSWATLLSQAVVEVVSGHRPRQQLVRWTTAAVYSEVGRRSRPPATTRALPRHQRAVVRSVHVCEPTDGVAEACALVVEHQRAWALALRMEALDGRWRCTELQFV